MQYSQKGLRASRQLFLIIFIAYAVISMSKTAYSSSIVAIVKEGIFTKSQAGFVNTGFYLTYLLMVFYSFYVQSCSIKSPLLFFCQLQLSGLH